MSSDKPPCIIALDLGTSTFKAAWVGVGWRLGPVFEVSVTPDSVGERITSPTDRLWQAALSAIRQASVSAEMHGFMPTAIGITSQAQTFVALNEEGHAVGPAVVWTDASAAEEAGEAAAALPDFAAASGFVRPSPLQFLPKVIRMRRELPEAGRFLLLNEWLIYRLTGEAIGDTNQQGMGGFWDNSTGSWNGRALNLAGITPENLSRVGPAGSLSAVLTSRLQQEMGIPPLPVYSCGNDQSCAAVGGGASLGRLFCNFGTAMVVYGFSSRPLKPVEASQIAGTGPLPGLSFLLAVESECGSVLEQLAARLYPGGGVGRMVSEALAGIGSEQAFSALEALADRFGALLDSVSVSLGRPRGIYAGGGLSRSRAWLQLLERRHGVELIPCATEHPGLRGAAKIIESGRGEIDGASV